MTANEPEPVIEAAESSPGGFTQWAKDALFSLSLANLVLAGAWFEILYHRDHGYFNAVPVKAPTLLALLANLAWLSGVAWLGLRVWHRTRSRAVRFGIHVLFFVSLIFPADFLRFTILKIPDYRVMAFVKQPVMAGLAVAGCLLILWQHRRVARVAAGIVGIFTPLAMLTVGQTTLLLAGVLHPSQDDADPVLAAPQPARPGLPRVIWIIFDEMDYRLAFAQRPASVSLPNFDQLRRESLFATNAYPPGGATMISMPALISGRQLAAVTVAGPSQLLLQPENGGQSVDWRCLPSVFSSARELGANTALVGWYHPYSRVLADSLNYCVWYPHMPYESARGRTFGEAFQRELAASLGTVHQRELYIDLCRRSQHEAEKLVGDADYQMMLLHLPPPHKPGVYLPAEDEFTAFGIPKVKGYFNNLLLADHMLKGIRESLARAGLQHRTWLVVSSDHWWRESAVYDGQVDHRVPFIVHPPGSTQGLEFGGMINTIVTHDCLLAILRGEVRNVAEIAQWLAQRPSAHPPDYDSQKESAR